jgi:hypothetical protein
MVGQSAGAPVDVVPVSENRDGEDEDGDDDQAGGFELAVSLVWHVGRIRVVLARPIRPEESRHGEYFSVFLCDLCELCG